MLHPRPPLQAILLKTMKIKWKKVCNEYLPIAVVSIIIWQIVEGFVYMQFQDLYLVLRNLIWNTQIGVPLSIIIAFAVTKVMHRPKKQERIIFVVIVLTLLAYIYGAVGYHPDSILP